MEDDVHPTPRAGPTTAMPPRAHPGRPLHAVWAPLVGPAPWPEPSPNAWATSGSSEPGAPIRSQQALGPRHLLLVWSSQGLEGHSEHVTRGGRGPRPETGCGPPGHPLTSRRSLRGGGQWAPRQPACRTREVTPETQRALGVTWGRVTADGTSDCLQWWGGGVYLTRAPTAQSAGQRRQGRGSHSGRCVQGGHGGRRHRGGTESYHSSPRPGLAHSRCSRCVGALCTNSDLSPLELCCSVLFP